MSAQRAEEIGFSHVSTCFELPHLIFLKTHSGLTLLIGHTFKCVKVHNVVTGNKKQSKLFRFPSLFCFGPFNKVTQIPLNKKPEHYLGFMLRFIL